MRVKYFRVLLIAAIVGFGGIVPLLNWQLTRDSSREPGQVQASMTQQLGGPNVASNSWCGFRLAGCPAESAGPVKRNQLTKTEQFMICFASFGLKPLYELIALAIALVIWRRPESYWRSLRWGMVAFFLGENACAINFLFYELENFTWEFWHCYGMLVAFGFVFYALLDFVDHSMIRYSDQNESCAFTGLCKGCYKHKPVACNIWIMMVFLIPALMIASLMPLTAPFKDFSSMGSVFGDEILFTHSILQQLFEIRIYPVMATLLFAGAWIMLLVKREAAFQASKVWLAAGLGVIGFSMMRFIVFWSFSDNILWAEVWEEITEFLFILTIVVLLNIRRIRQCFSK